MASRAKAPPQYEERLILFFDFLGFKEIVDRTAHNPAELKRLLAAMNEIGRMSDAPAFASQRVTQFSDSVVLSYRVDEESGAFWMINEAALTVVSLASRGYLLRGAITSGQLYHDRKHVVGPAMVAAVTMEEEVACFPRVVVDPKVLKMARRYRREGHTRKQEEEYVRSFIREDKDGQLFLDYVSWEAVVNAVGIVNDEYPDYVRRLGLLIKKGLAHEQVRVAAKYVWLHRQYRKTLENYSTALADPKRYRVSNVEFCQAMAALPVLKQEARDAKQRIERAAESSGRS